ncbi:hypothetical protein [Pelagicoccus sp. SDUM812002]|uniref:hypothetical protein n=1 Tax=Pelagicoccus sp. SDUM812002 TaxID=3041266 RepID=UPI00280C45C5|nr:hypothetical protein [Pelagicoccus sp. SDUM812002]MDQ8184659.1 hypothetical protein [Pelagicoccus sp. SDUM812002]
MAKPIKQQRASTRRTFEADAGDSVLIIVSEQVPEGESESLFRPNINLFDPDGELLDFTNGAISAHLNETLPKTGQYTVRVNGLSDVWSAYYAL